MTNLNSSIEELPKTTKPLIAALKKLGIFCVADLLQYFPYRYLDFSQVKPINELKPGEMISLKGTIKSISSRFSFRGRMSLAEGIISDSTGSIKVVWFNQPYLAKSLKQGEDVFLAGKAEYYKNQLQLTNPIYEKASEFPIHTSRLVPLYHLGQKIYPKTFRNLVASVLNLADEVTDILPTDVVKNQKLPAISETIRQSHFPNSDNDLAQAKKRLAFEEIFLNQLMAQKYKLEVSQKSAFKVPFKQELIKTFVDSLPFSLTSAQKKAAWEILQDLEKEAPMNRLLEGDVGSGKTLVALMAALEAMDEGLQAAFLAPTEILAKQHFETAKNFSPKSDGRQKWDFFLLTNNYSKINAKDESKKRLQSLIAEGMPGLFIGTHALLQKKVKFKNLALVIIDEQHRFGVEQRATLIHSRNRVPHLLSLTATPIPRTLQLAFFGELDVSQIKSKPADRKPIITKLVLPENRSKAYEFIAKQVSNGRQAFVITPLIEESDPSRRGRAEADKLGVKSAKTEFDNLKKIFPNLNIGLLHGKMKGKEKEDIMASFLNNSIHILVSTSVVEVGVDVPNASVMVIEAAERFGLAQLHQFRGRVGRAEHQSYCFLFTTDDNLETQNRLEQFTKTQDGFELAELDLRQRGFGQIYGAEQSGWDFKYFDLEYQALIEPAKQEALKLLKEDLTLQNYPLLKEKIAGKTVHLE